MAVWASSMALSLCLRLFPTYPSNIPPDPESPTVYGLGTPFISGLGARGYLGDAQVSWPGVVRILRHWGLDLIKSHSYPSSSSLFDPPDLVDNGDDHEEAGRPWDDGLTTVSREENMCQAFKENRGKRARSANSPLLDNKINEISWLKPQNNRTRMFMVLSKWIITLYKLVVSSVNWL